MSITGTIATTVVSKVLGDKCSDIVDEIYGFTRKEWGRIKVDLDVAFSKYEENALDKYGRVKTLLYRSEPQPLMDFFEVPYISYAHGESIKVEHVSDLLNISNFLILKGTGGIGKSTLLKYILIKEIEDAELIPIFIELKDLNSMDNDYDLISIVMDKLIGLGCTIDRNGFEYALKQGCFLFLLDGYDELHTKKQETFIESINRFCDRYKDNYFIISSRPLTDFVEFNKFTVLSSKKLDKKQAISLIQKLKFDDVIKKSFIDALDKKLYKKHRSFASNPLLLNLMLLTYDNYAEIPEKLHVFYAQAFETLYSRHDATKAGFKREVQCGLSYDSFVKVFSAFCCVSYINNKYRFSLEEINDYLTLSREQTKIYFDIVNFREDLINYLCVIYKDGYDYVFTHRSFQEYFTAVFLKELDDDLMSKMALRMIENDCTRAIHDNTFTMLYDMTQDRFERNVVIPLLKKIEGDNKDYTLYDYYLKRIVKRIAVDIIDFDIEYEEDEYDFDESEIKLSVDFNVEISKEDTTIEDQEDSGEENYSDSLELYDDIDLDEIEEDILASQTRCITNILKEDINDKRIKLTYVANECNTDIEFIDIICGCKDSPRPILSDEKVIQYLYELVTQNRIESYEVTYQQFVEDKHLYDLIKDSWIGIKCQRLALLNERLKEKNNSSQIQLMNMFKQ